MTVRRYEVPALKRIKVTIPQRPLEEHRFDVCRSPDGQHILVDEALPALGSLKVFNLIGGEFNVSDIPVIVEALRVFHQNVFFQFKET